MKMLRYGQLIEDLEGLLEQAKRQAARAVNAVLTTTYWEVGRRIVQYEQHGLERARYGERLLENISTDLTRRAGRGFSRDNLELMRRFFLAFPRPLKSETVSRKSGTASPLFPLSWSHCVVA